MATLIENTTHTVGIRTDHSAVFLAVKLDQNKRGPGYWKMNSSVIIKNKENTDRITE